MSFSNNFAQRSLKPNLSIVQKNKKYLSKIQTITLMQVMNKSTRSHLLLSLKTYCWNNNLFKLFIFINLKYFMIINYIIYSIWFAIVNLFICNSTYIKKKNLKTKTRSSKTQICYTQSSDCFGSGIFFLFVFNLRLDQF